jgi:hypothetical protein
MLAVRNPSFLAANSERETLRDRRLMAVALELDPFGLPKSAVGTDRFGLSRLDGRPR